MLNVEWSSTRGRAGHSTFNIEHSTFRFCYPHSYPVKPFLLSLAVLAGSVASAEPLRVGSITIHALDVYSSEEASKGWVYRAADRLHIDTRRSVIEQFLLFHTGDEYRPELLAQTERNLRARGFLKSASVVASPPHDGVVDVVVTTQDAWSIAPETQAGNKGGASTYGAQMTDSNVLGFGKDAEVLWSRGIDRSSLGMNYSDPAFFAPYWNAKLGYDRNSDGYDHQLSVARPFYSFDTRWATELSFNGFEQDDHLYAGGREAERFRHHRREIVGDYGVALAARDDAATRLTGGVRLVDNSFAGVNSHPLSVLPEPREFRYLFVRLDHVESDFVKMNFVNKDVRFEDFNLGRQASMEAAISPRTLGTDETIGFVRLAASDGTRVGGDGFVLPSVSLSSRFDGGPQHTIASSSVLLVRRAEAAHPRALVGRIALTSGWRVDRDLQFFADGLTGLRGYRAHTFAGDRAIIMNLEERLYLGREILQLASPAVVGFIDAGNATSGGFGDLMKLKTDIGVGLRVGLPRTPKNLLRVDFSYALNDDPLGRRGWMMSFSSGQAF